MRERSSIYGQALGRVRADSGFGANLKIPTFAAKVVFVGVLALFCVSAAYALNPEAEKRKNAGNEYQKRRDYDSAKSQYMEALRLEPDYADAHYNLGMLYFYRVKDFPRALYHLNTYRRLETGASDMAQVVSHINQSIEQIEAVEREEYKAAVLEASVEGFEKFLSRHPVGYYSDFARNEIQRYKRYQDEKAKREATEFEAFARANSIGTVEALDTFLAAYPDSPKAEEARTIRVRLMERNLQEKLAYQKAINEDTAEALEEFARTYTSGTYAEAAKSRATHLRAAEESLAMARETGSVTAMQRYLEVYSDTPYASVARGILEEFRKAEIEKAAAAEALKIMNEKKEAESKPPAAPPTAPVAPPAAPVAPPAAPVAAPSVAPAAAPQAAQPAQTPVATTPAAPSSEDLSPKESDAKKRAEAREKARRAMERMKMEQQKPNQ